MVFLLCACQNIWGQVLLNGVEHNFQTQLEIFPQEKIHLHLDRGLYNPGDSIWFRVYVVDASSHQLVTNSRYVYVDFINEVDSVISSVIVRPDSIGSFYGYIPIHRSIRPGTFNIRAYTMHMKNYTDYIYQNRVQVVPCNSVLSSPIVKTDSIDYDVQFFPEGGQLPTGVYHKVAFKSIGMDGIHCDIKGYVLDDKKDTVTSFVSTHLGMGYFVLKAADQKKYYAVCTNSIGLNKTIELPLSVNEISLNVCHSQDKLVISLSEPVGYNIQDDSLFVLIQTRGVFQYLCPWDRENEHILVSKQSLPSGVSQISLVNGSGKVISERLVFVNNPDKQILNISHKKSSYGKQGLVRLSLKDLFEEDEFASISISVTDNSCLKPDSSFTILSNLLLSSELKGYIEDPGYYTKPNDRIVENASDLLMLTQGWRRYKTENIICAKYLSPLIPYEKTQSIFGLLEECDKNKFLIRGSLVNLFVRDYDYYDEVVTDNDGHFLFNGFEFPDSTLCFIQGKTTRNDSENIIMHIYDEPRMHADYFINAEKLDAKRNNPVLQYNLNLGGNSDEPMYIDLPNIEIKGKVKDKKNQLSSLYDRLITQGLDYEAITKKKVTQTDELLNYLPGMFKFKKFFQSITKGKTLDPSVDPPCIVVVNDVIMQSDFDINMIPVTSIESIGVISGPKMAIFGSKGSPIIDRETHAMVPRKALVININKKTNIKQSKANKAYIYRYLSGYQKYVDFYIPKYSVTEDKIPTRATIFWNPSISINRGFEKELQFFTTDVTKNYTMIIEGITSTGKLIRRKCIL